jgi:hypothetical protein
MFWPSMSPIAPGAAEARRTPLAPDCNRPLLALLVIIYFWKVIV